MHINDSNLYFIRHAETTFNSATEMYKQSEESLKQLNFDQLSQIESFRNGVRFHHSHIDCSITEKGKKECLNAREFFRSNSINPDLILVSPLNRALETCHEIFGTSHPAPVVVQPLIGQILKSSCDISHEIEAKKQKFEQYDFKECEKLGDHWYLVKNLQRHFEHFRHIVQESGDSPHKKKIERIIHLMNEKNLVETQEDLLVRSLRTINKIKQKYSPEFNHIAIVSHFMFMDCISATKYDDNFVPLDGIKPKNCQVYSVKLSKLVQKSQFYFKLQ